MICYIEVSFKAGVTIFRIKSDKDIHLHDCDSVQTAFIYHDWSYLWEKKVFFCELCDCINLLYNNGQPLYTPPDWNLKNAQFTSTIKNKPPVIEYWVSKWVSDCCLMHSKHLFSYMTERSSYISMRWWWCLFCTRSTHLAWLL